MQRKNLFQRIEELKENIDGTCDRLFEIADDPKQLLKLALIDLSFSRPCSKKKLEPGDIIAVKRKLPYQHFAVYIGDNRVIHFAAEEGDWAGTPVIHEAPFENFLRDSDRFEILEFSNTRKIPGRYEGKYLRTATDMMLLSIPTDYFVESFRNAQYHLYTPEETVERAKMVTEQCAREGSKIETWINGHKYNLVFNNCEHFAIWCKTGVHESRQVDRIIRFFVREWCSCFETDMLV